MIRQILTSLAALALAAPLAAQEVTPDPTDWAAITGAAEGQTVYWHAWGGSNAINDYIAWAGDEVALRFTPVAPPTTGSRRRYVLHTHGYYKDLTFDGSHDVEPLPFGAMSNYPYDTAVEHYPDDPDHTTYRQTYNTRVMP